MIREHLIRQLDRQLVAIRALVGALNDEEKAYMQQNSVAYARLVDTIVAHHEAQNARSEKR